MTAHTRAHAPGHLMSRTARPRSAMQHERFFFTKMFLLLMSRCAMDGLPGW